METLLFAKLLLSSCSCLFAYLMVVAQQQVYMPQYTSLSFAWRQFGKPYLQPANDVKKSILDSVLYNAEF
jgi:hypothetical protein